MNNGWSKAIIYAALAAALSVCACAAPASLEGLRDDSGNIITSAPPAERIISLAPANTEIVYALGLEDRLVGVTEFCNYPPSAADKTKVGGFSTVDIEKAVALKPDLVLAAEIHDKSAAPQLQKMGFRVVSLHPKTVEGVIHDIRITGRLCGADNAAAMLTADLQKRVDAVITLTADMAPELQPRTLIIIWNDPLMVAGRSTLIGDIIGLAGGTNVAADISGFASMNLESIISADPQVIIVPTSMDKGGDALWDFVTTDPRLANASAIKNNCIYKIDGDLMYRHGPRCITALEQTASFLHPDLFGRPSQ
ncbi:MAG: cobalamin-binding protein [Dehalococcoidia bacterium]|nr:cobalamin-binding protein [Dehalococcoidia bacterium]